ncbi:PHP domain-containing protein [Clostridium tarantellae]|uniref:Histidinol-phosphatase n=1 Tax=Clostridium tarantellae TaxID=39493 RepID=A0A6I1MLX4_9CLOT|nr:histidinol-phosphatase [Clostridium tarantellae]MPQ44000.1 histidinol-phosphatase [Clostridium tarantellae]
MNIDFHVHGLISKKMHFDENIFLQGINYAKESGLDAFIMCEHFNAVYFEEIYNYLNEKFPYRGDRYLINDFSVFLGIEVSVKNKGHIILSSGRDEIIHIRKILEKNMDKNNFIELEELLNLAKEYNCLKIGAHPYRKGHKLYLHPNKYLNKLDALDLNGKDIYNKGLFIAREEVENLSKITEVNIVTGSDSHYPIQLGSLKTILKESCFTIKDIKNCIKNKEYEISISNSLNLRIFSSKIIKKCLLNSNM